ncbi:uncharacterized protein LOC112683145 isoform X2 [Sipha flava]|nr:uncharacterized protein LOC112683145 isoform X2 [Sipha flava]
MNAEERREARRRRILQNSETRLKKITTLSTNENLLDGQSDFIKDEWENSTMNPVLSDWPVPKCNLDTGTSTTILEEKRVFNFEPNHLNTNLHSKNVTYKIKCSPITILHIILSQIVLVLFYYDLGFLFGNSVVVPFLLSIVPELYTSKEQHDSIHMVMLLMLGLSQNSAKWISRCIKLTSVVGKRFCIYIFCFVCSYAMLTLINFDIKHTSSIT